MKQVFEKIKEALCSADFRLHLFVCFIIAVVTATLLAHLAVGHPWAAVTGAFLTAMGAGLGKEYGDSQAPGNTWSWSDVAADAIGAAAGAQIGWAALLI